MVECTGLENRRTARYRGFESLPDRSGGWHLLAWGRTGSHNRCLAIAFGLLLRIPAARCLWLLRCVLRCLCAAFCAADFSDTSGWAEAIFEGAFYDPDNVPEWANGMTPLEMGIIAGFPEPPGVSAIDYNDDGIVDAADYTVWRDQMGPLVPPGYGADGDGDGYIGYKDYLFWKDAYGGVVTTASSSTRVPEPTTLLLTLLALTAAPLRVRCGTK